ncbi:MAG: nucleotide exchange factor GrpE [Actinomycetaceae bacterium]
MTEQEDRPREEPVVNDRRRIDPETGRVRRSAGPTDGVTGGVEDATATTGTDAGAQAPAPVDAATSLPQDGDVDGGAGEDDPLARAQAEVLELQDQLARRKADVYNVEQEYAAFVRRSRTEAAGHRQAGVESVVESLLGVLDDIDLARQHGDLTGPFESIATKLEQTLRQRFAFERFGAAGEEFDPNLHDALMSTDSADVEVPTIDQVLQPGYRIGEKIVRAARVAVHSPA